MDKNFTEASSQCWNDQIGLNAKKYIYWSTIEINGPVSHEAKNN